MQNNYPLNRTETPDYKLWDLMETTIPERKLLEPIELHDQMLQKSIKTLRKRKEFPKKHD
jgi:hypothetical protein